VRVVPDKIPLTQPLPQWGRGEHEAHASKEFRIEASTFPGELLGFVRPMKKVGVPPHRRFPNHPAAPRTADKVMGWERLLASPEILSRYAGPWVIPVF